MGKALKRSRDTFKEPKMVAKRPNHPDVGCPAHDYAICDYCSWTSPNLRREPKKKSKCGLCGKGSDGYRYCKSCEGSENEAQHLFDDDGEPT